MSNWYIIFNGQQVGPMPEEELTNYGLNRNSMVWTEGMPEWAKAESVPELAGMLYAEEASIPPQYGPRYAAGGNYDDPYYRPSGKKVAAGVLAILLGGLGIQYFVCGKVTAGFITILLTLVTCGLWEFVTLVQGILMLTMSDYEFDQKYVYSNSTFPLF